MKRFRISMLALVTAIACFAFTTSPKFEKGIGPLCESDLYYFKVQTSLNLECGEVTTPTQFDYSMFVTNDGDALPESSRNEVLFEVSDDNPHGCPDQTEVACTLGYTIDQLEINPTTQKWQPKDLEVENYKCCIRRVE